MTTKVDTLTLPHGSIPLPTFLPDATKGVVRSVDSSDLESIGIDALVMNTFHLMQHPGSSTIRAVGGLHRFTGWMRPIITDSGGFQVYSLLRQNVRNGSITDKGAFFQIEKRKYNLTPEKSIQLQVSYGADILFCLDDCTHVDHPEAVQIESVQRTIRWARRCKQEFMKLMEQKKTPPEQMPRLFAVVQGGNSYALRQHCAEALLAIGFDGYGYGGWPIDNQGALLTDIFAYVRQLIPPEFPLHALGVGHPPNIATCYHLGYQLFDSAMPTRDARNGRLYCLNGPELVGDWFSYLYIQDDKHIKADEPLCQYTQCWVDDRYSRAYLHHLFAINDTLALRLATLHNLCFMMQLMQRLRHAG